ncbi:hypothetical protein F2Q70_00012392 [Brassica cretica]|uniref:Uncharacterized protein n=1 Tax=Brassica cretica TaxID=69181 RepID=A0A8S9M4K7_BRACR|nr:hypothetical protein F2Q70_00012392 [Brassica cretica]
MNTTEEHKKQSNKYSTMVEQQPRFTPPDVSSTLIVVPCPGMAELAAAASCAASAFLLMIW